MELYEEVLIKALSQQRMEVTFPDLRARNATAHWRRSGTSFGTGA